MKYIYPAMILVSMAVLSAIIPSASSRLRYDPSDSSNWAKVVGSFFLGCGLMFAAALLFDIKGYLRYAWPFSVFYRLCRRYGASPILRRHLITEEAGRTLGDSEGESVGFISTTEDSVAVITCYFNPVGCLSLRQNYQRFIAHMREQKMNLFCAEVAFPGQSFPSENAFIQIVATDENALWQKERLFNLIVEKLPAQFDKIAFIDADILFFDRTWIKRSCEALGQKMAVQPFNRVYKLDPQGRVEAAFKSVGAGGRDYVL